MSERMQSLLSRAVEDQLSEQRQLAGALAEVRSQLAQLGHQLEGLQPAGGQAGPHLEQALGAVTGEVREGVRLLGERVDAVTRLVQQRGHDLAEQRAVLGELRSSVDDHSEALAGVSSGLGALSALGDRIDALQSTLGGLGDRLRGLEELTASVGTMQQRLEASDASLRELRQAFTGVAARAAQLPGREELDALGNRVAESVDALGGRMARLETAVPSLLERFDGLAETQHGVQDSIAQVHSRLESAPAQPAFPAADLAAVLNDLQAIRDQLGTTEPAGSAELAALADRVEALHEGVLGEEGVIARLDGLDVVEEESATEALDAETVEEVVAQAVAESEARLTAHIDDAILVLAEALLRRRTSARGAAGGGPFAARPSSVAGVIEDEDDEDEDLEDEYDEDDDLEDEDLEDEYDEDLDADDVEDEEDDKEPDDEDEEVESAAATSAPAASTPWQTPVPAAPADTARSAAAGKRKPWWRPGG